jgi:ribosomal protein S18 acetylase RimI-like enzyme
MHLMRRSLAEPIPAPALPDGYRLRHVAGEAEVENRAAAQHAAFESGLPMDAYCQRYLRFMRSPAYIPEMDIVAEASDGRIKAFCIAWLDPANHVGLFEPVGVHPAFQRRGLGTAVVQEGLRRMQAHGMDTAIVCSLWDNPASYGLYKSAGFQTVDILRTYGKNV